MGLKKHHKWVSTLGAVCCALFFLIIGTTTNAQTGPTEIPVQVIDLAGPAADRNAEISGLAWYGDTLILLPENPYLYATPGNAGQIFALRKADILAYLAAADPAPLEPFLIPILSADLLTSLSGFDGLEAITVDGDRVFIVVEILRDYQTMFGYLISGSIAPDLSAITLDVTRYLEMGPQASLKNISYESLLMAGDQVVVIYEANGIAVNPYPVVYVVGPDLGSAQAMPFPYLEYRLTDATAPAENGVFWVINSFFPTYTVLLPESDPLSGDGNLGETHRFYPQVERLVALRYTPQGIQLLNRPPIWLRLSGPIPRNWEGIALLDDQGFLLVTDEFPGTVLGFVPVEAELLRTE